MKNAIFNALNIKEDEGNKVFLLVIQSLFLGGFYGTFDIGAHTLFLKTFEETMIPKAYTLSGIIGIIMTAVYSKLQSKIKFSKLAVFNLLALSIIAILLRAGFYFTDSKWLIFLLFMMLGPLNILAMVGFWGTASRLFSLRQGKRLFGLVDTGQILGIIIAAYAIPIVPTLFNFDFETKNLILVSSTSIFVAFIFQLILSRKFNLNTTTESGDESSKDSSISFKEIFKNKYISYMALFVVLSMMVAFFIQYTFLVITNEKYPEEADLANYLGTFTGSMMIFTLLIKTTVYSNIMKTYGLKLALIISPALLVLFTIIAALIGTFFGYSIAVSSSFILFFLIISLGKLFNKALKDAIEVPSFKILYQSLDSKIRFDVQAKIDGTINEFSALFSGIVLTVFGLIGFFTLIYFTYVLVIILVAWTFISIYLYAYYRKSLETSLDKSKLDDKQDELIAEDVNHLIRQNIESTDNKNYIKSMYLARLIEPGIYYNLMYKLLENSSKAIRKFAINQIGNRKILSVINQIKEKSNSEKDNEIKKMVTDVHKQLTEQLKNHSTANEIRSLGQSRDYTDRILCAQIISTLKVTDHIPQLIVLLRDLEPEVRKAAILASGKFKHPELIPAVIDNLASPTYQRYASASIEEFGEDAVDQLEQAFYKTGLSDDVLILITRLLGIIKGDKAIAYLFTKINNNNVEIAKQAMIALRFCNFRATELEIHNINQHVEQIIAIIGWNMTALLSLKEEDVTKDLIDALNEENKGNYELLFNLLALAYDSQSIQLVRKNLESGTSEGIGFAIELLDLFVAEEMKPLLFPLFEDTPPIEKIKILQDHFPIEIQEMEELVNSIINRDPNFINRWTKVCAIRLIYSFENYKVTNDILAHLFNSDKLIRETAGLIIKKLDSKAYSNTNKRMNTDDKQHIEEAFLYDGVDKYKLMYSKNNFLKKLDQFAEIPGRKLTKFANRFRFNIIEPTDNFLNNFTEENIDYLFLIEGKISIESGKYNKIYDSSTFINEIHTLLPFSEIKLKVLEKSMVYFISKNDFDYVLFNNPDIAKTMINEVSLEEEFQK